MLMSQAIEAVTFGSRHWSFDNYKANLFGDHCLILLFTIKLCSNLTKTIDTQFVLF